MATVIGPTPPGTGVIHEATSARLGEIDVAAEAPVGPAVDPDVDHHGAGLDPVAPTCSGRPIAAIRMSAWRVIWSASRVAEWQTVTVASPPGPFCKSRRAIDLPTICDRPRMTAWAPLRLDPRGEQHLADAQRRAGDEPGPADRQEAGVLGVEAVDVLARVDPLDHPPVVDLRRQGELDEDPVDVGVGVQGVDRRQELRLGHVGREPERPPRASRRPCRRSACSGRRPGSPGLADQDDRQAGHAPGRGPEPGDLRGHLVPDRLGEGLAVEDAGGQRSCSEVIGSGRGRRACRVRTTIMAVVSGILQARLAPGGSGGIDGHGRRDGGGSPRPDRRAARGLGGRRPAVAVDRRPGPPAGRPRSWSSSRCSTWSGSPTRS